MKKALLIIVMVTVTLGISSCKRTNVADPSWQGPVGFNILLEGSVTPALLIIDGHIHSSMLYVKVTDSKGNPLPNETVFIEQLRSQYSSTQVNWGYFTGNLKTIQLVTNANGEVYASFFWPTKYYSYEMWLHALLVISGRSNIDASNIPQDYISLTMIGTK